MTSDGVVSTLQSIGPKILTPVVNSETASRRFARTFTRGAGRIASVFLFLSLFVFFSSCTSTPPVQETPLSASAPATPEDTSRRPQGIAEEIRSLVETGTPPSLLRALDLIRSRDLGETEYGRAMVAVAVTLMRRVYPEISADLPTADPPPTNIYSRILRDAERGAYTPAASGSTDYLEHVLPFIALLDETRSERLSAARPELERAATLNTTSVLDPYFRGMIAERRGRTIEALAAYDEARGRSADCYPAVVASARILSSTGRSSDAISLLSELLLRYPDNLLVKRELARAYYEAHDWIRASSAIAEILQRDPKDTRFMLMRARALVEQGSFVQAQPLLDAIASTDERDSRLYLFLRARVQAEGYHNRDSALAYLRSILRSSPNDEEVSVYTIRLLLDSSRSEENREGRQLLTRLLSSGSQSLDTMDLALKDAILREAWTEAAPLSERLLAERRSVSDLQNAYIVRRGLKENDAALSFAKELYEREPSNDEWAAFYASALTNTGKKPEALKIIDSRLSSMTGGSTKSRFYYLRSRLRSDEETAMGDLRSSLFEDPRNLDSLIAMLEIYRSRKDERRTIYYLKQALALAPDNPLLKKYQVEYSSALGGTP